MMKTVFLPRALPRSPSWNEARPVRRHSFTSYSPGERKITGSPPTDFRLAWPGWSWLMVTTDASVLEMAWPDLGSGGSVRTVTSRPRSRKQACPSQVISMRRLEEPGETGGRDRGEHVRAEAAPAGGKAA